MTKKLRIGDTVKLKPGTYVGDRKGSRYGRPKRRPQRKAK